MAFQKQNHVGEVHDTKNSGRAEIIEDNAIFNNNNERIVKIRFIDTGYITNIIYKNLKRGFGNDPTKDIYDPTKIYHSNNYGDYNITEYLGNGQVKVKFIDTNYEYITRKTSALNGKVKDQERFMYDVKDKIFTSFYYGPFKIISQAPYRETDHEHKHKMVNIQFLNTGAISTVAYGDCLRGSVSDPTYRNPQEVPESSINIYDNIRSYLFMAWKNIKERCSNANNTFYKNVTLCDEWQNFEAFFHDAQRLPCWKYKLAYPLNFEIDKDLLQADLPLENRYYSRNTCIWLSKNNNLSIANGATINKYYDDIYEFNGLYFVKASPGHFSHGPYLSLQEASMYKCPLIGVNYNRLNDYPMDRR